MWHTILHSALILTISGLFYLGWSLSRMETLRKVLPMSRILRMLSCLGILVLAGALGAALMGMMNTVICFLHLLLIWLLTEAVFLLVRLACHRPLRKDAVGLTALFLTVLILSKGWYNAHHVSLTRYDITTTKDLGKDSLSIVAFSDSHLGATFHSEEFSRYIQEINLLRPDVVVIVGDYVDDSSSMEDLVSCSKALGDLKARYGVYYVYGNHDRRYYSAGDGYTQEDLVRCLKASGVRILKDEVIPLTGNTYLIGRDNASRGSFSRLSAQDLMRQVPQGAYSIVLDHQPNDFLTEAASHMDLVLSGHTHGGQFWPLGHIGVLMGANDFCYGHKRINATDFIVSSGIGDWELDFKTGCISEYVLVKVHKKAN